MDDQLQKDGFNAYIFTAETDFDITEPFVLESSITVEKNGILLDAIHWSYDSNLGKVIIDVLSGETLLPDDEIEIRYHYFKKYSDEGIEGYIEASFTYFVQYKYPKTFEICNGEIVATNNIEPTLEEKYLIALVTSIVIEPNGLNISTPDFSFRPNDKRTIDEKISTVFKTANRAKGLIDFLDTDC